MRTKQTRARALVAEYLCTFHPQSRAPSESSARVLLIEGANFLEGPSCHEGEPESAPQGDSKPEESPWEEPSLCLGADPRGRPEGARGSSEEPHPTVPLLPEA